MLKRLAVLFASVFFASAAMAAPANTDNPRVRLDTSMGAIVLELYPDKAPKTVANFLDYVRAGHYDGTIFHRVIKGFMIQGGGFTPRMEEKPTRDPVPNEADNGLENRTGTIAMARTSDPDSATAQFFINTADNDFLDFKSKTRRGWGYTVFGRVVDGMDVVRRIESVPTRRVGPFENVPQKDVVIEHAEVL